MNDWRVDLDGMVQESIAFGKSVAIEPPKLRTIVEPNRLPPVNLHSSERQEIRQRVSNFMAHQERFSRERGEFAASQMKRMLWGGRDPAAFGGSGS